ncbi:MAG: hypothetical protein OXE94_08450 [Aestuariivita sp.]|nr:hypothetical protein [Aestuariivita sp.]MCY4203439.1 hypothetical protein [Aestuariivita sp.]
MNDPLPRKPIGAHWRRVRDFASEYHAVQHAGARQAAARWKAVR